MWYSIILGPGYDKTGNAQAVPFIPGLSSIDEALDCARSLFAQGEQPVAIQDGQGNSVEGDDLVACLHGDKQLTPDLKVIPA